MKVLTLTAQLAQFRKIVYDYTNVYGSTKIYHWKEICCEGSGSIEKGAILSHYILTCSMPWNFLTKSYCASWLSIYHYGLQLEDGMIPYMAKRLITMAAEYNNNWYRRE